MGGGGPAESGSNIDNFSQKIEVSQERVNAMREGFIKAEEIKQLGEIDKMKDKATAEQALQAIEFCYPSGDQDRTDVSNVNNQELQKAISEGKSAPANMVDKFIGLFPPKLQDFLKALFSGMFGKEFQNINTRTTKLIEALNSDKQKIFKSYESKIEEKDGGTIIRFSEPGKVTGIKESVTQVNGTDTTNQALIAINDKTIKLDKETKITNVEEKDGKLILTAKNKDETIDTYTIKDAKKKQETPTATA